MISEFQQNEPGLFGQMMVPGIGQEMYKTNVDLDIHFTKVNKSPFGTSSFSLARGYRARIACQGQEQVYDSSRTKE